MPEAGSSAPRILVWLLVAATVLTSAGLLLLLYGLVVGGREGLLKVAPAAISVLYLGGFFGAYAVYNLLRTKSREWEEMRSIYKTLADYLASLHIRDIEAAEFRRLVGSLDSSHWRDGSKLAAASALFPPALLYTLYRVSRSAYEEELKEAELLARLYSVAQRHGVKADLDVKKRISPPSPAAPALGVATAGVLGIVMSYNVARQLEAKTREREKLRREIIRLLETLRLEKPLVTS